MDLGALCKTMWLMRYKHILAALLIISFLSFISVYHYMTTLPNDPPEKPGEAVITPGIAKLVNSETRIYVIEKYEVCDKYLNTCHYGTILEGAARNELNNLTEAELAARYPHSSGWNIIWEGLELNLEHSNPGLCPEHSKRWHFGADEKGISIGVYLGPSEVGIEGGLVQATNLEISRMPPEVQTKIREGSLQFLDWEDVIATLDSFAEYQD